MTEDLLHFLCKHQCIDGANFKTTQGETLSIISPGYFNIHGGPDFNQAQIRLNKMHWAGSVEIHIKSSDWYSHNNQNDPTYDNIILHVVWEDDIEICRTNGDLIPTLILQPIVSSKLLEKYQCTFQRPYHWIPCENDFNLVPETILTSWKERLFVARLENKAQRIQDLLKDTKNDWEATLFALLARNFGLNVNGDAFFNVARSMDFSIVRKNSSNPFRLEALFLGQAGLLSCDKEDPYLSKLREEYRFLSNKFGIQPLEERIQFTRLRPMNFPTIRWVQLAQLYSNHQGLLAKIMNEFPRFDFSWITKIEVSSFWETHYSFNKKSHKRKKQISNNMLELIVINTIIPFMFCYFKAHGRDVSEELLDYITTLQPEKNGLIKRFGSLHAKIESALDTQALIELKKQFCDTKKCVNCHIGAYLLNH